MSEKVSFTPGPWVIGEFGVIFDDKNRDAVCELNFRIKAVDLANAKLISAAPDLLGALESLTLAAEYGSNAGPEAMRKAQLAIAKARGES